MNTMRYIFPFLFVLILAATTISGCSAQKTPPAVPSAESVSSTTSLSGTFRATGTDGSKGVLSTSTGPVEVESLVVDLSTIDGETVTLTGKYSGDTLFVSEVE
jgi:hypothetical protein